jgi:hypothetical protein
MEQKVGVEFQLKDTVVVVPLLASTLAISWEIGRFIPTRGFQLFSLSEHLPAATAALPFAVLSIVTAWFIAAILGAPSTSPDISHTAAL